MNTPIHFSTVIRSEVISNRVETELLLNAQHPLYQGHFPENPVTPGAVILQLFKEQAEEKLQVRLLLKEVKTVKFLQLIHPIEENKIRLISEITENETGILLRGKAFYADKIAVKVNLIFKKG